MFQSNFMPVPPFLLDLVSKRTNSTNGLKEEILEKSNSLFTPNALITGIPKAKSSATNSGVSSP